MNQDEIIEMAKQSGLLDMDFEASDWEIHEFTTFAKLVAAKEREACAKLCDSEKKWWDGMSHSEKDIYQAIDNISALIRARGKA